MAAIAFRDLPLLTRIATLLSPLIGWVCFEEFIIDRQHLDSFLPFYRVGGFCVYDCIVILLLGLAALRLHRHTGIKT